MEKVVYNPIMDKNYIGIHNFALRRTSRIWEVRLFAFTKPAPRKPTA